MRRMERERELFEELEPCLPDVDMLWWNSARAFQVRKPTVDVAAGSQGATRTSPSPLNSLGGRRAMPGVVLDEGGVAVNAGSVGSMEVPLDAGRVAVVLRDDLGHGDAVVGNGAVELVPAQAQGREQLVQR